MKRDCVFQNFTVRGNFQMGSALKDLGLYTLSLLIKFIAFIVSFLAQTHPVHCQQMDSTTGLIFIQGYVSMKVLRAIWNPHGDSGSCIKDFVVDRPLTKNMK